MEDDDRPDESPDERLDRIEREEFISLIAPTENPRSLLPFACALMVPPSKKGESPEQYQPPQHPVQQMILVALSSSRWRRFVIVACTQDGKTWLMAVLLFWIACENKEAVIWGGPDMRIAQDTWRQKIEPALDASGLGGFRPTNGAGSAGGTDVETVQLAGGGLVIFLGAGGANKSGQAGRTARWVLVDEFGKVKPELSSKFDRRADAFDLEGRLVKAGTVEHDDNDQMLAEYDLSSRGRLFCRCHLCGKFTSMEWECVDADWSSEVAAAATVHIRCGRCDGPWTDDERKRNLLTGIEVHAGQTAEDDGTVSGDPPDTYTYGMRWSALDSPRRSLSKLAADYVLAKQKYDRGDSQSLIDFFHDQLTRKFPRQSDEIQDIDAESLAARSAASTYSVVALPDTTAQYVVSRIPPGVEFASLGVDQSKRRLWYLIRGHDRDGRSWILGWGRIPICADLEEPTTEQRIAALNLLETIRDRGLPMEDGGSLPIAIAGVDIGYAPAETITWIRSQHAWIAVRGTGDRQMQGMQHMPAGANIATVPGWYQLREYAPRTGPQYEVIWIDSDAVKNEMARSFRRPLDTTGTSWLPRGLSATDHLVAHLTAEKYLASPGGKFTWVKQGRFSDWLDCTYYTTALARYLLDRYPERTYPAAIDTTASSPRDEDGNRGSLGW